MRVESQQLMAFLLDGGLAKKSQLDAAQKEATQTGKKLETALIEQKIVT